MLTFCYVKTKTPTGIVTQKKCYCIKKRRATPAVKKRRGVCNVILYYRTG